MWFYFLPKLTLRLRPSSGQSRDALCNFEDPFQTNREAPPKSPDINFLFIKNAV